MPALNRGSVNAMRTTTMILLGLLALACGGSGDASDEDTSGTSGGNAEGSSTGGPTCTPGTEGCACNEGMCEGELSCFSEICVAPPAEESSSSTSVDASTSSTSSGSGSESSGPGDETAAGSSSGSSSTGTAVEACEEEGNHLCQDGVLDTCERGEVVSQSCDDLCAQTGFLTTGCADINGCGCDGYADANCETITEKFCNCYAMFGSPCDASFELNVYGWCFDPTINESSHDIIVCFGEFPTDTLDECNAASDVCFNL